MTSKVAVATYNMGDGPDRTKVADLEALDALGVSVVKAQEGGDRRRVFRRFCRRHPDWSVRQSRKPGGGALPVAWRHDVWQLLEWRSVLAVGRRWVGPAGAGPTYSKPKRVTVVVLRHRDTGQVVTFLDTHMVPSATRRKLGEHERKARLRHYGDHVDAVAGLVRDARGAVVLGMDANAPAGWYLLQPLKRLGLTGWSMEPTHGDATYDHVVASGLELVEHDVVVTSSDHLSVVHVYALEAV